MRGKGYHCGVESKNRAVCHSLGTTKEDLDRLQDVKGIGIYQSRSVLQPLIVAEKRRGLSQAMRRLIGVILSTVC